MPGQFNPEEAQRFQEEWDRTHAAGAVEGGGGGGGFDANAAQRFQEMWDTTHGIVRAPDIGEGRGGVGVPTPEQAAELPSQIRDYLAGLKGDVNDAWNTTRGQPTAAERDQQQRESPELAAFRRFRQDQWGGAQPDMGPTAEERAAQAEQEALAERIRQAYAQFAQPRSAVQVAPTMAERYRAGEYTPVVRVPERVEAMGPPSQQTVNMPIVRPEPELTNVYRQPVAANAVLPPNWSDLTPGEKLQWAAENRPGTPMPVSPTELATGLGVGVATVAAPQFTLPLIGMSLIPQIPVVGPPVGEVFRQASGLPRYLGGVLVTREEQQKQYPAQYLWSEKVQQAQHGQGNGPTAAETAAMRQEIATKGSMLNTQMPAEKVELLGQKFEIPGQFGNRSLEAFEKDFPGIVQMGIMFVDPVNLAMGKGVKDVTGLFQQRSFNSYASRLRAVGRDDIVLSAENAVKNLGGWGSRDAGRLLQDLRGSVTPAQTDTQFAANLKKLVDSYTHAGHTWGDTMTGARSEERPLNPNEPPPMTPEELVAGATPAGPKQNWFQKSQNEIVAFAQRAWNDPKNVLGRKANIFAPEPQSIRNSLVNDAMRVVRPVIENSVDGATASQNVALMMGNPALAAQRLGAQANSEWAQSMRYLLRRVNPDALANLVGQAKLPGGMQRLEGVLWGAAKTAIPDPALNPVQRFAMAVRNNVLAPVWIGWNPNMVMSHYRQFALDGVIKEGLTPFAKKADIMKSAERIYGKDQLPKLFAHGFGMGGEGQQLTGWRRGPLGKLAHELESMAGVRAAVTGYDRAWQALWRIGGYAPDLTPEMVRGLSPESQAALKRLINAWDGDASTFIAGLDRVFPQGRQPELWRSPDLTALRQLDEATAARFAEAARASGTLDIFDNRVAAIRREIVAEMQRAGLEPEDIANAARQAGQAVERAAGAPILLDANGNEIDFFQARINYLNERARVLAAGGIPEAAARKQAFDEFMEWYANERDLIAATRAQRGPAMEAPEPVTQYDFSNLTDEQLQNRLRLIQKSFAKREEKLGQATISEAHMQQVQAIRTEMMRRRRGLLDRMGFGDEPPPPTGPTPPPPPPLAGPPSQPNLPGTPNVPGPAAGPVPPPAPPFTTPPTQPGLPGTPPPPAPPAVPPEAPAPVEPPMPPHPTEQILDLSETARSRYDKWGIEAAAMANRARDFVLVEPTLAIILKPSPRNPEPQGTRIIDRLWRAHVYNNKPGDLPRPQGMAELTRFAAEHPEKMQVFLDRLDKFLATKGQRLAPLSEYVKLAEAEHAANVAVWEGKPGEGFRIKPPVSEIPSPQMGLPGTVEPTGTTAVTRDMQRQLADLGYSRAQMDAMTPDEAAQVISAQRTAPRTAPAAPVVPPAPTAPTPPTAPVAPVAPPAPRVPTTPLTPEQIHAQAVEASNRINAQAEAANEKIMQAFGANAPRQVNYTRQQFHTDLDALTQEGRTALTPDEVDLVKTLWDIRAREAVVNGEAESVDDYFSRKIAGLMSGGEEAGLLQPVILHPEKLAQHGQVVRWLEVPRGETPAGYWIAPDGMMLKLKNWDHHDVALRDLGLSNGPETAYEAGYVRILADQNGLSVDVDLANPESVALARDTILTGGEFKQYVINSPLETTTMPAQVFKTREDAVSFLDQAASGERSLARPTLFQVDTTTPNFQTWFAGSKVVDENGRALQVYHGTAQPGYTEFDKAKQDVNALYGPGFYFTENPTIAGGRYGSEGEWLYFDTEAAARSQPGRVGPWWKDDTTGKWIAQVDMPRVEMPGYAHRTPYTTIPEGERKPYLDAIRNSREYKRAMDGGYLAKFEMERVAQYLREVETGGHRAYLDLLMEQPYNIPVRRILERAGVEVPGGVYPTFLNIKNPLRIDEPVTPEVLDNLIAAVAKLKANGVIEESERYPATAFLERVKKNINESYVKDLTVEKLLDDNEFRHGISPTRETNKRIGISTNIFERSLMQDLVKAAGYDGITHMGGGRMGRGEIMHRVWIPFEPTQIKSAIGNRGTFDPRSPNILYQAGATIAAPDWYYSQLTRTVEGIQQNKMTVDQLRAAVNKGGVKADELKWTGFDDWLAEHKGSVTKQEALDYLRQNQVRVEEVTKGTPSRNLSWTEGSGKDQWVTTGEARLVIVKDNTGRYRLKDNGTYPVRLLGVYDSLDAAKNADQVISLVPTRYGQYTLPGGENYRELLLTLPPTGELPEGFVVRENANRAIAEKQGSQWIVEGPSAAGGMGRYAHGRTRQEALQDYFVKHGGTTYRAPHWDEPNVLAHVRFNDRVDADGKRVLFIEEVQSDWHEAGRKHGYLEDSPRRLATAEAEVAKWRAEQDRLANEIVKSLGQAAQPGGALVNYSKQQLGPLHGGNLEPTTFGEMARYAYGHLTGEPSWYSRKMDDVVRERVPEDLAKQYNDAVAARQKADTDLRDLRAARNTGIPPQAPFSKTWEDLAMKRMIRYAAENGYDRVAWTTGKQQSERYDLAKMVDEVAWKKNPDNTISIRVLKDGLDVPVQNNLKNLTPQDLEGTIGKEATKIIVEDKSKVGSLTGQQLAVGGEGMRTAYDVILPEKVNKYVKKWGAKVGETEIFAQTPGEMSVASIHARQAAGTPLEGAYAGLTETPTMRVHSFDVTPQMRESAMRGQALFQRGTNGPANLYVGHNLSEANLAHADELGGLAMPSLAITSKDVPFEGYGEITLLANREMVNPRRRGNVVGDADLYSPRYPEITYKINRQKTDALWKSLSDGWKETYGTKGFRDWEQSYLKYSDLMLEELKSDAARHIENDRLVALQFLKDRKLPIPANADDVMSVVRGPHRLEFADYAAEKLATVSEGKRFFKGWTNAGRKRYADYTLDNIVREMKSNMREGEGFNYGAGSVRAQAAKRFRTMEGIQKERGRIVAREATEKIKEGFNERLSELASFGREHYRGGEPNPFIVGDRFIDALKEGVRRNRIAAELKEWGFELTEDEYRQVYQFVNDLKAAPTEYFEAKPQRAVGLQEFSAAVIPNTASKKTRDILAKHGLETIEYDPNVPGDRQRVVAEATAQRELLFQGEGQLPGNPQYTQQMRFDFMQGLGVEQAIQYSEQRAADLEVQLLYSLMERGVEPDLARQWVTQSKANPKVLALQIGDLKWSYDKGREAIQLLSSLTNELNYNAYLKTPRGRAMFQQGGANGVPPKAATQFMADGRALVKAFSAADVSSLVHESAHIWFGDLDLADLEIVGKWAGLSGDNLGTQLVEWHGKYGKGMLAGDDLDAYTRVQEKWARGFERYLADGYAPTPELKSLFEQFKEWLMFVYQSITGSQIDVPISDDVRTVMDKLFVGSEIRKAESEFMQAGAREYLQGERGIGQLYARQMDSFFTKSGETTKVWLNKATGDWRPVGDSFGGKTILGKTPTRKAPDKSGDWVLRAGEDIAGWRDAVLENYRSLLPKGMVPAGQDADEFETLRRLVMQQREAIKEGKGLQQAPQPAETPAFRNWFGKSKVVDRNGRPMVMYTGTANVFTQFDPAKVGSVWGDDQYGFFFVNNPGPDMASGYALEAARITGKPNANVMPVYLKAVKPLDVISSRYVREALPMGPKGDPLDGRSVVDWFDSNKRFLTDYARSGGYDSIIVRDPHSSVGGNPETLVVVFKPIQIKSAIGNRGTFSPTDPNILFQRGKTPKGQGQMFTDTNEDLPLFSGTAPTSKEQVFKPEEKAGEQTRLPGISTAPEFGGKSAKPTMALKTEKELAAESDALSRARARAEAAMQAYDAHYRKFVTPEMEARLNPPARVPGQNIEDQWAPGQATDVTRSQASHYEAQAAVDDAVRRFDADRRTIELKKERDRANRELMTLERKAKASQAKTGGATLFQGAQPADRTALQAEYDKLNNRLWELAQPRTLMERTERGRIQKRMSEIDDMLRPARGANQLYQAAQPDDLPPLSRRLIWQTNGQQILSQLDDAADWVRWNWGTLGPATGERAVIDSELGAMGLQARANEARAMALKHGEATRAFMAHDFEDRRAFDTLALYLTPWSFWGTREGLTYLDVLARNPAFISAYLAYQRDRERINASLPPNYRNTVEIPSFIPMIGGTRWNLEPWINPVYQQTNVIKTLAGQTPYTPENPAEAMLTGSEILGRTYPGAEGLLRRVPMPWNGKPLLEPGLQEQTGMIGSQTPLGPLVEHGTAALRQAGINPGGIIPPGGVTETTPLEALGVKLPVTTRDVYDIGKTSNVLTEWLKEGRLTQNDYDQAIATRQGKWWEDAQTQASANQAMPEIVGSMGGPRFRTMYPTEQVYQEARADYKRVQDAMATLDSLGIAYDRNAMYAKFNEQYPWYGSYVGRYASDEERQGNYQTDQFYAESGRLEQERDRKLAALPVGSHDTQPIWDEYNQKMQLLRQQYPLAQRTSSRTPTPAEADTAGKAQTIRYVRAQEPQYDDFKSFAEWDAAHKAWEQAVPAISAQYVQQQGREAGAQSVTLEDVQAYDRGNDSVKQALDKAFSDWNSARYGMTEPQEYAEYQTSPNWKQYAQAQTERLMGEKPTPDDLIRIVRSKYGDRFSEDELRAQIQASGILSVTEHAAQGKPKEYGAQQKVWANVNAIPDAARDEAWKQINAEMAKQNFGKKDYGTFWYQTAGKLTGDELAAMERATNLVVSTNRYATKTPAMLAQEATIQDRYDQYYAMPGQTPGQKLDKRLYYDAQIRPYRPATDPESKIWDIVNNVPPGGDDPFWQAVNATMNAAMKKQNEAEGKAWVKDLDWSDLWYNAQDRVAAFGNHLPAFLDAVERAAKERKITTPNAATLKEWAQFQDEANVFYGMPATTDAEKKARDAYRAAHPLLDKYANKESDQSRYWETYYGLPPGGKWAGALLDSDARFDILLDPAKRTEAQDLMYRNAAYLMLQWKAANPDKLGDPKYYQQARDENEKLKALMPAGLSEMEDEYFKDGTNRRQFINTHPQLKAAWDAETAFEKTHPVYTYYYHPEDYAKFFGTRLPAPDWQGAVKPQLAQTQAGAATGTSTATGGSFRRGGGGGGGYSRSSYQPTVRAPAASAQWDEMERTLGASDVELLEEIKGYLAQDPGWRQYYALQRPRLYAWLTGKSEAYLAALTASYDAWLKAKITPYTRQYNYAPQVRYLVDRS